ncbi:hypothetical protein D7Y41_18140 [Anaerotruncus sp. 1XD22-93]|nr:hypothetical protein [Lachnospiraceae bacterium]NBI75924.1 hypothetical protein [Lachnospiraceae bacterium]RKJ88688.1 hypothetical protein D7Y41_18140 [Anaerotruncus sp. 1XD22-93]
MIKIAVCDDEAYMTDILDEKITEFFEKENIAADIFHFSDGDALLQAGEGMDVILPQKDNDGYRRQHTVFS